MKTIVLVFIAAIIFTGLCGLASFTINGISNDLVYAYQVKEQARTNRTQFHEQGLTNRATVHELSKTGATVASTPSAWPEVTWPQIIYTLICMAAGAGLLFIADLIYQARRGGW